VGSAVIYPEHRAPLSIKCVRSGVELYRTGRARHAVDTRGYLILNENTPFASEIEDPAESFCIYFREGFVASVAESLLRSEQDLADDPRPKLRGAPHFVERIYPHDAQLSAITGALAARAGTDSVGSPALDGTFAALYRRLLELHFATLIEAERFPAVRASTR